MQIFKLHDARYLGSIPSHQSIMKLVFLLFVTTVSSSRAIELENEATLKAVCDNSTMQLTVNFTKVFRGAVYQSRNYFNSKCSYTVPIDVNVTELELSMQYRDCDIKIEKRGNLTIATAEISIQMHNLLDSVYDRTVNVSCEINNFHLGNETESEDDPFAAPGLENTWIEFKNGLVLLGEVGEPTDSSLFFVVNVRDDGSNRDMMVQNCIAHTDRNITNLTTLTQLSNFYGCPDPSDVVTNFTVRRVENDRRVTMFAYAPITNFSLIATRGRMTVSCGVTICENACPAHCNDTESPVQLPYSDYATKDLVMRNDGVVMPDSLRELNRHNDRSRRAPIRPKRSLGSFISSIFHWESRVMTETVSEGNVTNITSTRRSQGMVMKNKVFAKEVLVSANKNIKVNLTKPVSNLVDDEVCLDGQTFRLIALMAICLFTTVTACYCCYADKRTAKRQTPSVF